MGFNKFTKADGIRIVATLFLIGIVYLSFGSSVWSKIKTFAFQLPTVPATLTATPRLPAQTPSPTHTPAPTSTFMPTPIPTSVFLPGELTSFWNEFDNTDPLRGDWVFAPTVKVENGLLIIDHSDDWNGVYGNQHLNDGQTVLIQFRFDMWSDLHFAVETGEFQTDSYRSWGVGANNIFAPVYSEGTLEFESSFEPEGFELDPGTWYVLMLHIGGENPFSAQIWEYGNNENFHNVEIQMDETWEGQTWLPLFLVGPAGRLEIERYEELKSPAKQ
jgi:hypothetical protein